MNNNPIFDAIQQCLSQGDTGKALEILIAFLEKDPAQADFLRSLRVVEANYNAARQREIKGILEFSDAQREYAKTNDALLSVLEDLKTGRKPSPGLTGTGDGRIRHARLPWLVGGGILLLAGILAGWFFSQSRSTDCPPFNSPGSRVLILPFQNLAESKRNPELSIQSRIQDLTTKNQLATCVEILHDPNFEKSTPDIRKAAELGAHCQAEMVIWGQYEALDNNAISVDINYTFTNSDWPNGTASQVFKNVSEIKTAREVKLTELDDAIFRICMALALREDRLELAEKWLNKIKTPNQREIEWKKLLEAR